MNTKDKKEPEKKWRRRGKILVLLMLLLVGTVLTIFFLWMHRTEQKLKTTEKYSTPPESEDPDAYREVAWNGEIWHYREGLIQILCLGVDGRDKAVENTAYGFGPRADAIYLVTLDTKQKKMTLLNISRDTITDIRIIDSYGTDAGLSATHLCMQYACGDGLDWSCEMTSEAVSRLLNGIPIHAYCALYWNAITPITDLAGPIGVEVPEYMTWVNPPVFHESGWTEMDARQALEFVRDRDIESPGSNEVRSVYQQEFLQALFRAVKEKVKEDPRMIREFLSAVEEYLVTDLDTDETLLLALWAGIWGIDELDIKDLPGESVEGLVYDEFHVDVQASQELLIEMFYEKE